MKPSFLTSTLSIMAILSLLTIIACVIFKITIPWELLAVFTSIIWAYTGARIPWLSSNTTTDEATQEKKLQENSGN